MLNSQPLESSANSRIFRLREKLTQFAFTTKYVKGKSHCIPDALSRAPVSQPTEADIALNNELNLRVAAVATSLGDLVQAAQTDEVYAALAATVRQGFPKCKEKLDPRLLPYFAHRHSLSLADGLVLLGDRVVVPYAARRPLLEQLHRPHLGVDATRRRATCLLYTSPSPRDLSTSRMPSSA